jgi:hypothetical protein
MSSLYSWITIREYKNLPACTYLLYYPKSYPAPPLVNVADPDPGSSAFWPLDLRWKKTNISGARASRVPLPATPQPSFGIRNQKEFEGEHSNNILG